jgi:RimJ/RimL family protein N-acetyltransferase
VIAFPLETERLVVRPLVLDDAEALHELFSDREAMQFLTANLPSNVDESRRWVQQKIDLHEREDGMSLWAVVERESGHVVGDVGLQWEDVAGVREVDLGCRIIARYGGRGYGTQASRAALRAGFDQLGLRRITAMTAVANAAARRVLEKLGLGNAFDGLHDIHAMDYVPKPDPAAYARMCERWDIDPTRALMVEDMARNLHPAKALGMVTVWIDNGSEQASHAADPAFIDYRITDIGDWLSEITGEEP